MTVDLPEKLWFERPFDALLAAAQKWPQNEFLSVLPETARHYGIEPRAYTFEQSRNEVEALRAAYAAAGVCSHHRVGLMLENRPAFFFHWFALNGLGAAVVPLNPDWRGAELEYVIGHSELVMAIVPEARRASFVDAAVRADRRVTVATEQDVHTGTVASLAQGADTPSQDNSASSRVECALLYTSGTTGRPKGCVLLDEYFMWAGQWYATIGGLCDVRPAQERMITPLPTAHMNAMAYSTMCMLLTGGCLIALDRFHPKSWWRSVRESRATIVHYLGVMPAMLLSAPISADDRSHSVRFGFGAGVGAAQHAAFEQRFGFPLIEAWAMTETGAGAVVIANREPRLVGTACFGRPDAAVEVRIDAEDLAAATVDVPGELLVRAAGANPRFGFFDRYLKDDAATQAAWEGGWFHTGDIVRRDAQGLLHFVDRKKNVIRRSGENISAAEVEVALSQHPMVKAVGVAAVPDTVRGEEVFACIVPTQPLALEDQQRAAEDIVRFGLQRLAYYKPPGYVYFCDTLPRTSTEKIQRGELKRLAQNALADPNVLDMRALKKRSADGILT